MNLTEDEILDQSVNSSDQSNLESVDDSKLTDQYDLNGKIGECGQTSEDDKEVAQRVKTNLYSLGVYTKTLKSKRKNFQLQLKQKKILILARD